MTFKNASLEDFDMAFHYIEQLWSYNSLGKYQIQSRQKEQFWIKRNCSECDSFQLYQGAEL